MNFLLVPKTSDLFFYPHEIEEQKRLFVRKIASCQNNWSVEVDVKKCYTAVAAQSYIIGPPFEHLLLSGLVWFGLAWLLSH